jgi:UDP-N-acetylglucosamine acyltransferase
MNFTSINKNAVIGKNFIVREFTIIEDDVEIGDNVEIGSNVLIASGSRIRDNVKIFHGAVIGTNPQDLKYKGEDTTVEIGEGSVIREYATLNKGTSASYTTKIGKDCFIMAYTHIAHDCCIGDEVIIANGVQMGGHVTIDKQSIIGGIVGIHQFTHIGRNTILGFLSRVSKDVPPFITASGNPLKYEGLNNTGLRRKNFTAGQIKNINSAYDIIYRSGKNISDSLIEIKSDSLIENDEVKTIVDFIESSKRGVLNKL